MSTCMVGLIRNTGASFQDDIFDHACLVKDLTQMATMSPSTVQLLLHAGK